MKKPLVPQKAIGKTFDPAAFSVCKKTVTKAMVSGMPARQAHRLNGGV